MAPSLFLSGGQKIPAIGYGTWQSTDEAELENALNVALETGYRHIDCAYVYGNEHVVGKVLSEWFSQDKLKREDVFITTKLPLAGIHEDRVEIFIKKSLENLQLDYVDLYLIHFPVGTNYIEGCAVTPPDKIVWEKSDHKAVWKKMEEQVDAGLTKAIGLSNFNKNQINKIIQSSRIKPGCLQVELHACLQQTELVDFCHQNDIVVVAYSPLGSPGYNSFLSSVGQESKPLPNMLENPEVQAIAEKHNKSTGQVLLRFLIQKNVIPIPKSVTPSRIKENFDIFDFTLDDGDMKKLGGLDVGESARVCDFKFFAPLLDHPEYPWRK